MTSRIVVVAIDAVDPVQVADFWCDVLGWEVAESEAEGVSIASRDGSSPAIDVCRVPEGKSIKNRLHFDLRAQGVTRDEELQRLLGLGARRIDVGQAPDVSWVVLADPEGNEFCLLLRTFEEAIGA
jgi:predicted enzyme related to lactoylglutathione lyase